MKRILLLVLCAAAVLAAGCGSSSSSTSSQSGSTSASSTAAQTRTATSTSLPAGAGGPTIHVKMQNLAFSPTTVQAKVGQTVQWVNDDNAPHNVTGTGGPSFAASSTLNKGQSFSLKLTKAGTIKYVCTIHPFMKATIVVK